MSVCSIGCAIYYRGTRLCIRAYARVVSVDVFAGMRATWLAPDITAEDVFKALSCGVGQHRGISRRPDLPPPLGKIMKDSAVSAPHPPRLRPPPPHIAKKSKIHLTAIIPPSFSSPSNENRQGGGMCRLLNAFQYCVCNHGRSRFCDLNRVGPISCTKKDPSTKIPDPTCPKPWGRRRSRHSFGIRPVREIHSSSYEETVVSMKC